MKTKSHSRPKPVKKFTKTALFNYHRKQAIAELRDLLQGIHHKDAEILLFYVTRGDYGV